jgi:hypothetical protein
MDGESVQVSRPRAEACVGALPLWPKAALVKSRVGGMFHVTSNASVRASGGS